MDFKENLNVNRARIGTVVFHAILLLLVIFIKPDNLEGGNNSSKKGELTVPLAQANEGSGSTAQASTVPEPTKTTDSPSKATENSAETKAVTNNDPNSPVSASDNNEKSSDDDANENPNETTETKNQKDEQEPEPTPEEIERQQQKAEMDRLHNTNNESQNQDEKEGKPGGDPFNPDGDREGDKPGVFGPGDFSLVGSGRSVDKEGEPEKKCGESGIVVVKVTVDADGKVVDAIAGVNIPAGRYTDLPEGKNSEFVDDSGCLRREAESAARNTTWTPKTGAKHKTGYIVYRFELK